MQNFITQFAATVDPVNGGANTLTTDVVSILNAIIAVLGIVCVVVMIIGGINYMTSAGDAGKVKKGKDTILYGMIGLVISALSFAIVNWVIVSVLKNDPCKDICDSKGATSTECSECKKDNP